jgi:uncharacterized protein (DUF1778 family)
MSISIEDAPILSSQTLPAQFYEVVGIARTRAPNQHGLAEASRGIDELLGTLQNHLSFAAAANERLMIEAARVDSMKATKPTTKEFGKDAEPEDQNIIASKQHFVFVFLETVYPLITRLRAMKAALRALQPANIPAVQRPHDTGGIHAMNEYQAQLQYLGPAINPFLKAVHQTKTLPLEVDEAAAKIISSLETYTKTLIRRHRTSGLPVYENQIVTDVGLVLIAHTDAAGELADGVSADQVSDFTVRKATEAAQAILENELGAYLTDPGRLLVLLDSSIKRVWDIADLIRRASERTWDALAHVFGDQWSPPTSTAPRAYLSAARVVQLDPRNITPVPHSASLSVSDRARVEARNQTLAEVCRRMVHIAKDPSCWSGGWANETIDPATDQGVAGLVRYILTRKAEAIHLQKNSTTFYTCRIGAGNQAENVAPGALEVIPGRKPSVRIEEIVGTGFDQVKTFLEQIRTGRQWDDLFTATSPSKGAPKSNALLVGPGGCGKSHAMRAIATNGENVAIYAQASDFNTCWKGESDKNPKRLFESAMKLRDESGKDVFLLIDEIDSLFREDPTGSSGSANFATEFQQLLDGLVSYPGIFLWGATNHPEDIPTPMIRRFHKVLVVGELADDHRKTLLKQYLSFLPISAEVTEDHWDRASRSLQGAVGDIIRKIADDLWRTKMTDFVSNHPEEAQKIVAFLRADGPFLVDDFSDDRRTTMLEMLRPHVHISTRDLDQTITSLLANVGIKEEIRSAVDAYARSKDFLAGIRGGKRGAPPARVSGTKSLAEREEERKRNPIILG